MKEGITMFAEYPDIVTVNDLVKMLHIGMTGNIYTHLTRLRKENIGKDLENVFRR